MGELFGQLFKALDDGLGALIVLGFMAMAVIVPIAFVVGFIRWIT